MKKIALILSAIIVFISCSKNTDKKVTALKITNSQWYLTRTNYGVGLVNLEIEGSTDGDKVTIRTFGDGAVSDENVELDSRKGFSKDVVIAFFESGAPLEEFEITTQVMAYQGADTIEVTLNSGKLKF